MLISPFVHIFQEILNRIEESKVFAQNISSDVFLFLILFSAEKGERMY